jgi:hypothetical protein
MRRQKQNRSVIPAKAGTHANSMLDQCFLLPWMRACPGMTPCIGNVRRALARTFAPVTAKAHSD